MGICYSSRIRADMGRREIFYCEKWSWLDNTRRENDYTGPSLRINVRVEICHSRSLNIILILIWFPVQYGWSLPPFTQKLSDPVSADWPKKPALVRINCTWVASSRVSRNSFDPWFWTRGFAGSRPEREWTVKNWFMCIMTTYEGCLGLTSFY